jgi:hypothetical protein
MEPGGDDDHATYEAWLELDPERGGLIDCRAHHEASNAAAAHAVTHWHDPGVPPIQNTWGPLIRTLLAFIGTETDDSNVARYQRDEWGSLSGQTALIELSALHARNLGDDVDRLAYRSERIADIRDHLMRKDAGFAIFYGLTYEEYYAQIAGDFGPNACRWSGDTLCVLVVHPAYRFAPGADYWISLGHWLRVAVNSGPGSEIPARPPVPDNPRKALKNARRLHEELPPGEYPIIRNGENVGRVIYDGWNVRVEQRTRDGEYRLLGFYERSRSGQIAQKIAEIGAVFDDWARAPLSKPLAVKANWRAAQFVAKFAPPADCIDSGCAVLEEAGIPVAYIYKTRDGAARWTRVLAG